MDYENNIELQYLINEWITTRNRKLVKKLVKLSCPKYIYKLCKANYRSTRDGFFISSMNKINLFYKIKSKIFLKEESRRLRRLEQTRTVKINEIKNIIHNITPDDKFVYIMQYSFFDKMGENYFSGGGERYACDLADLINKNGYKPILIQSADEHLDKPWHKKFNNIDVIGVNACDEDYFKIINSLEKPKLAIYSGAIAWNKDSYKPSILISHGITWDYPGANANIFWLGKILQVADIMVSVDTNTISWFRSTFAKTIADNDIQMNYVPNYVDLEKYSPVPNLNKNGQVRILFPRRCSDERGFWLLADIIPDILDKYCNVEFNLVGYAHTEKISKKIIELQNMYPNKIKHMVVDANEMHEVYKNADITLIPTLYSEGTSLSCIEAMACGNAVISTDVGGLPNLIINNYNGILVSPCKKAVKDAVENLIANPSFREKLSKNAADVALEFSKKNWSNNWNNILRKALEINSDNIPADELHKTGKEYNIKGLRLFIDGNNNVIDIDESADFFQTAININASNCYIKIGKVKYVRCSTIYVYNGDNQSLIIDDGTSIEGAEIYCCGEGSKLNIGKNCMLARGISVWTADGHTIIDKNTGNLLNRDSNTVIIGDNTWVAQDSKILKRAQIAPNSIIGANSIVTKKFDEESVLIAGNPAKIIKYNVAWNRQSPHDYEKRKNVQTVY